MTKSSFTEKYGPWALITGASRGMGVEFAHQCAKRGLNTILIARSTEALNEQAGLIKKKYGVEAVTIPLDLSQEDILDVITPITDDMEIGLVINNAGLEAVRPFLDHTLDQLLTQLHLNARAALILAYHFGVKMAHRKRGGIIFVSSASSMNGTPYAANYAGTKAYNLLMGESLWYELRNQGIDVLGFMPGITKTPGLEENQPKLQPLVQMMGVENTVAEAFDTLGKKPSWIAGKTNRFAYFLLSKFFSRSLAIRTVGKSMRDMFGPFN